MTEPAIVKSAELRRMAKIAKEMGVSCWIEHEGRKFGVSPDIHNTADLDSIEKQPANSLAAWRGRHEGKARGNPPRKKEAR
ncbi:hypothetical protein V6767_20430 [Martelella sp. FLE1502]